MYWKKITYSYFKQLWWRAICLPVVRKSCVLLKKIGKMGKLSIFKIEMFLKKPLWFYSNAEVNSMYGFGWWWNQNLFDINLTSMNSNTSLSHFFIYLVVGGFRQLRFEQGLKQTHNWFFRLTVLKGHVFLPSYIGL